MQKNDSSQVLFVHGAGAGAWEWNIWQRVFRAQGWRTHAVELEPRVEGLAATRLDDYAAQVASSAAILTPPPVLIGASLGGLLALIAASRVAPLALALINPVPPADLPFDMSAHRHTDIVPWGSRRSLGSTQRAMPDADAAARLYALRHWRDESGAVLRDAGAGVFVAQPPCPTLVLASEHDADVPFQTSRALAVRCNAEFHLLRGASHVGPLLGRKAHVAAEFALHWIKRTLHAR